jgi:hypothetical protein
LTWTVPDSANPPLGDNGEQTWLVAPYWDTPNGRAIDMSLAARVTYRVQ